MPVFALLLSLMFTIHIYHHFMFSYSRARERQCSALHYFAIDSSWLASTIRQRDIDSILHREPDGRDKGSLLNCLLHSVC